MSTDAEVLRDYLDGMPESELLNKHSIARKDVNRIRKEHGIPRRHCNVQLQRRKNLAAGEVVTCHVCGRQFQNLSSHVKIHGLTPEEYSKDFGSELLTPSCHVALATAAIEKFNRHPELRDRLREVGRSNITKVNAAGKGWRTPAGFWSEEQKAHLSQVLANRQITWADKIKESHWSRSDKARDVIDKICASNKRYQRGWYVSSKTGEREFYHSSYELRRMLELDDDTMVVKWTKRHAITIPYQYGNVSRKYVPDFLVERVDGHRYLEEVKGHLIDRDKELAKFTAAHAWCWQNGYSYFVVYMGRS